MYVDKCTAHANGKTYTRYLLRESRREDKKTIKTTILNITPWGERTSEALRFALANQKRLGEIGIEVADLRKTFKTLGVMKLTQQSPVGDVWLLHQKAMQNGLVAALGDSRNGRLALWQIMASRFRRRFRVGTCMFRCMHEILARYILVNTEKKGQLYTPRAELDRLDRFDNIDNLVSTFNGKLYHKPQHQARRLKERNGHFYICGYESDTVEVIQKLTALSVNGVQNYTSYVDSWLALAVHPVDCEEKKAALRQMFCQSSVALIYGSAGTGKSTFINQWHCR